jgi:hypothetical protein
MALEKRVLPKGTVIHMGGLPFRTEADVIVASSPGNFCVADTLGEPVEFGPALEEEA